MSANSAPRHLLLAASAAALLLAGTQLDGIIGKAHAAADLDTLIMASMQSNSQTSAVTPTENKRAKTAGKKSSATKEQTLHRSTTRPVQSTAAPAISASSGGGLLAAIGVLDNTATVTTNARPEPIIEDKRDRTATQSGPTVFQTSGYGQGPQTLPVPVARDVAQMPASAVVQPSVTAPSPANTGASKKPASRAENPAAKPVILPAVASAPPASPAAPVSSGLGGFFAALGIGGEASPSPMAEPKADKLAMPTTSADLDLAAANKPKERPKSDVVHTGSVDRPASKALGAAAPSRIPSVNRTPALSADTAKPIAAKNLAGDSTKPAPRVVVAALPDKPPVQSPPVQATPVQVPIAQAPAEQSPIQPPAVQMQASNSGGLLAALGIRTRVEPGPMEANAQIPIAYRDAAAINAEAMVARGEMVVATRSLDYRVDAGDKLRVVVFGQEGLTNTYAIDAGGGITMPLIGRVAARGQTPGALAAHITERLRKGYIREPSVAVEIESYRPFYILGEVAAPGQYPYVPNMSVEAAVAIAGGFSPRARRDSVILTHKAEGAQLRAAVPLGASLSPGDTIMVSERWF